MGKTDTQIDTQVDTQVETGNVYIDSTISALSSTIVRSISGGGHDHLLLRAALLELCSLYGSQLIPNLAEEHKRKASYYLRRAADANTMYQTLRSDVQDIASGETLTENELESLPSAILQHLVSQQLKLIQDSLDPEEEKKILQENLEQEEKDRLEKIENGENAI